MKPFGAPQRSVKIKIYVFSLHPGSGREGLKEIRNLNSAKVTQDHEIPTKILKENAYFPHPAFNECFKTRKFPSCLTQTDITTVFEKGTRMVKKITDQHFTKCLKISETSSNK